MTSPHWKIKKNPKRKSRHNKKLSRHNFKKFYRKNVFRITLKISNMYMHWWDTLTTVIYQMRRYDAALQKFLYNRNVKYITFTLV